MPKFLCLPGYLQTGKVFAEKSSGIRKLLTKKLNYDLDYIDPPVQLSMDQLPFQLAATEEEAKEKWDGIVEQDLNRCWWHAHNGNYDGFNDSLDYVIKHMKENGPYDGIIGFSQGAAMSAIVANSVGKLLPENGPVKVAVLFSSFAFTLPRDPKDADAHLGYNDESLDEFSAKVKLNDNYHQYFSVPQGFATKVLLVYGSEDQVVPPVRVQYLNRLYGDHLQEFKHEGGHFLPNKKPFLQPIVEAIQESVEAKPSL